jgi:twitching motility protein PilT
MSKLDVYLRSIEKLGADGAVLTSGQSVMLRFPNGERHATPVTSHDQLVTLVRELAPPEVFEQIDKGHPARIEIESGGRRYGVNVTPRGGAWQIAIDALAVGSAASPSPAAARPRAPTPSPAPSPAPSPSPSPAPPPALPPAPATARIRAATPTPPPAVPAPGAARTRPSTPPPAPVSRTSGVIDVPVDVTLDQLTHAARAASATDLYLSAGTPAMHRIHGELVPAGKTVIDAELISRELGAAAPQEARAAWTTAGTAMFTYGDGSGRVRVTLARDHRGPSAALRLLPDEPPSLGQLKLGAAGAAVEGWLGRRGLVVIAGPSGCGKTITLGALVRALGERRRRVVTIEDPIELVHASAWISQRAIGEHVASVNVGVSCAMNEAADAIVIGRVCSEATARGVVEAVSGGHLVLTTVVAPAGGVALDRMIAHLPADQRELAHGLLFSVLLGMIQPVVGKSGERSFEIAAPQA